jgi:hypothetical protein
MQIRKMIFTTAMSALVSFGLYQQVQSATDTPDPGGTFPTSNTADGQGALGSLTTGLYNSAFGFVSVLSLTAGNFDTGVGAGALLVDNGGSNTAVGAGALLSNSTGSGNNAVGTFTLFNNVGGSNNTGVGYLALENSTGDYNTALGANAGTDPGIVSNNIYVGDAGFAGDTNVISIGGIAASGIPYENTYIGGIYGATVNVGTAAPVYVDTDGHLGTALVNAKGNPSAAPLRRGNGVQHQAMLDRKVEKLQATAAEQQKQIVHEQKQISQQQRQIDVLMAQLTEQAAQIQKVSAQLEVNKPAPQVVANKP